jgi:starch-binding outer membrane protein, SusD/RagB family
MNQAYKSIFINLYVKNQYASCIRPLKNNLVRMKVIQYIIIFMVSLSVVSCKDWLDVLPENDQTTDEYWQSKEEVESVIASGYSYLRTASELIFIWGEARGNGITIYNSTDIQDAQKLRTMDILPTNNYAQWGIFYKVINMANSVIKYAPDVASRDASFNVNIMRSYLSEAYFQRALAYYYLVRTFKDVPYVTEPYVTDKAPYSIAKSDGNVILTQLVADLEAALPTAKEYFEEPDPFYPSNSKGRATKWSIYALLADINLWMGDYTKCKTSCDAVINSGRVGLIPRNVWFSNFFPGNSNESIFELQYSYSKGQTNSYFTWFNTNSRYIISPYTAEMFLLKSLDVRIDSSGDVRGINSTFSLSSGKIWKYIGRDNDFNNPQPRTSTENDQNFIIYRLADIYLMKAEAEIMTGNFLQAEQLIFKVRDRAGMLSPMPTLATEEDALDVLLEERHREFVGEGKNWFDILRIAQRDNYKYKLKLIDQLIQVASAKNLAIVRAKLSEVGSYYLPIHSSELKYNRLLVQNPYYENLGN